MKEKRIFRLAALTATALLVTVFAVSAAARPQTAASSATATCSTTNVLSGSAFEIDTDANLTVDGGSLCIDWLTGGTGTGFRTGVVAKNDVPSGSGDDAFGKGTSENDANPTIVNGSIPPNKSDLKAFGVFSEVGTSTTANPSGKFLELFWSRVQNPSGTTNMDFELNQLFCNTATGTNCAGNGTTPNRTAGDKLIIYDLANGGTVPTISIRNWTGSVWGPATGLSGTTNAQGVGSVNTSTIPATETGGATNGLTTALGSQDPFTFGEAAISFDALFSSGTCGSFGSAYLKSRSSTSFTSEVKDFIAPEKVQIGACSPTIATTVSDSGSIAFGGTAHDSATLTGASSDAGGHVTYSVFDNNACTGPAFADGGTVLVTNGVVPDSNSVTFDQAGTFYWYASYTGDGKNNGTNSGCAAEPLTVAKAAPTLATALSNTLISVGQSVTDTATLSGASSNATGTVTFHVYTNNTCTTLATTGSSGQINTQPSSGSVSGGQAVSGSVTFQKGGTYFWQAVYGGDTNNAPATSTCTSEKLSVIGQCVLGYPFTSSNSRTSVAFNESEVLRTFRGTADNVQMFYNDEHAMTLGENPGVTPFSAEYAKPNTTTKVAADAGPTAPENPPALSIGDPAATDPSARPIFPSAFVTDITADPSATPQSHTNIASWNDWQFGGTANSPTDVYGTWKPFIPGATVADPTKNDWFLGPNADAVPLINGALPKDEGYGAEAKWLNSALGLQSGHAYRVQFMVHDGDQNKTGGDVGEACVNIVAP